MVQVTQDIALRMHKVLVFRRINGEIPSVVESGRGRSHRKRSLNFAPPDRTGNMAPGGYREIKA